MRLIIPDFWKHRERDFEDIAQICVPVHLVDVEEESTRGVCNVCDVESIAPAFVAGELP